jgi:hypothetical protein
MSLLPFFANIVAPHMRLYFMCIEMKRTSDSDDFDSPYITWFNCYSLKLNVEYYWGVSEEDKGWATAIQIATMFAIVSASLGFIAFCSLASAVCFALSPRSLLHISFLLGLPALFQILTLIAGVADTCFGYSSSSCKITRFHVHTEACFAIFAFLFYVVAFAMTLTYYNDVRRNKMNGGEQQQPLMQKRIEREYTNERGEVIKEIIIENDEDDEDEDEEVG